MLEVYTLLVVLVSFAMLGIGLVGVVWPIRPLGMTTRGQAAGLIACGAGVLIFGITVIGVAVSNSPTAAAVGLFVVLALIGGIVALIGKKRPARTTAVATANPTNVDNLRIPDARQLTSEMNESAINRDGGFISMMEYDANKKSAGVAYILWFFFGMLGAHQFYLKKSASGTAILVLTITSILSMAFVVGFILIIFVAFCVFIDVFLIPGLVRDYNNRLIARFRMHAPIMN